MYHFFEHIDREQIEMTLSKVLKREQELNENLLAQTCQYKEGSNTTYGVSIPFIALK